MSEAARVPDWRRVTDRYSVSPQLRPTDLAAVAAAGFVRVINNRPDGEAPGQPTSASLALAAGCAGLDYIHAPIAGGIAATQIEAHRRAAEGAPGPVLAFCRSGTRSLIVWALGRPEPRAELIALAAEAGYDLSLVLP